MARTRSRDGMPLSGNYDVINSFHKQKVNSANVWVVVETLKSIQTGDSSGAS